MEIERNIIYNDECLRGLKKLPSESIDCCITSPPYFNLRDYGDENQFGLEECPDEYVNKLTEIFEEVRRVLKKEGTLWLNIGDSYSGSGKGRNPDGTVHVSTKLAKQGTSLGTVMGNVKGGLIPNGTKPKDLIGIPWMSAFSLRNKGWYLRQDIIWSKPNPMPESVKDRCTKSHEYIFLFSKSKQYYYDNEAIKTESISKDISVRDRDNTKMNNTPGRSKMQGLKTNHYERSNKRSVWNVPTSPFKGAHFATFPENLIIDCIKAGCPEGGIVLDPFMGSGTTACVARKLGRDYIGFELNKEYIDIAEKRLYDELGMFQ